MQHFEKVFWTNTALNDLKTIIKYIGLDSITRAASVLELIQSKANILKEMPLQGRIVPELQFYKLEIYRELIENPWRIIYKFEDNKVFVLAVLDGRRNVEDILIDRFL